MGILHIINRVIGRLLDSQFKIKIHLAVRRAGEENKTAGIRSYFIQHFTQAYDIAAPLG